MTSSEDLDLLNRLRQCPELFEALEQSTGSELSRQKQLRELFAPEIVRSAMALQEVRRKVGADMPQSAKLWLTRVAAEQATAWAVAQHKAQRFPAAIPVLDVCSGVGVDSAALLSRGPVTSIDIDPAMLLRCEWNLQEWRTSGLIAGQHAWTGSAMDARDINCCDHFIHADPDRRSGRDKATKRLENYCPDLDWMKHVTTTSPGGALKLGPASNFLQKFPGCEIELISLRRECREATVWYGELSGAGGFRATVLPSGETISGQPLAAWCPVASEPGEFIFDPDPAVVRSGLLDTVGEMAELERLDKEDEYLTGAKIPDTSFVTGYFVEACLPNNLRSVKKHLQRSPGRDYEVKCRRLKLDANKLHRSLPRGDGPPKTVFSLRVSGKAHFIIARRVVSDPHS